MLGRLSDILKESQPSTPNRTMPRYSNSSDTANEAFNFRIVCTSSAHDNTTTMPNSMNNNNNHASSIINSNTMEMPSHHSHRTSNRYSQASNSSEYRLFNELESLIGMEFTGGKSGNDLLNGARHCPIPAGIPCDSTSIRTTPAVTMVPIAEHIIAPPQQQHQHQQPLYQQQQPNPAPQTTPQSPIMEENPASPLSLPNSSPQSPPSNYQEYSLPEHNSGGRRRGGRKADDTHILIPVTVENTKQKISLDTLVNNWVDQVVPLPDISMSASSTASSSNQNINDTKQEHLDFHSKKKIHNACAAKRSRLRKKLRIDTLSQVVERLDAANEILKRENSQLKALVESLRSQIRSK